MDKNRNAYDQLLLGIQNYVDRCLDNHKVDLTVNAIVKEKVGNNYTIVLNNNEYKNIPSIGGLCSPNETVKVLIPQGNYKNMFILKGGIDTTELTQKVSNINGLTADSAIIKNIYSDAIVGNEAILNNLRSNIITTDYLSAEVAKIDNLTANDAFIKNIFSDTIIGDTAVLNTLQSKVVSAEYLNAELAVLGYLTADSAEIKDLIAEDALIKGRLDADEIIVNDLNSHAVRTDYLEANYTNTQNLIANYATISSLDAVKGDIDHLNSIAITTNNLSAQVANINSLTGDSAIIKNIQAVGVNADYIKSQIADIGYLTADSAIITELKSNSANVNTIMFGSATGQSLTTSFANAVVGLIGNAQIKSAMIDSISASKITSGQINTNLVNLVSSNGNLKIADNTIQIKDENSNIRLQIGKDASNDYNMYVWDANGNLMFNANGITENAIKSQIIRDDMVKDDANISASKINIDSLFSVINGSTNTIKSSKIYVDADNQTLDIAFKTLSDTVKENSETISSQGTSLEVVQGQISSKVWQQDITTALAGIDTSGFNALRNSQTMVGYKTSTYLTNENNDILTDGVKWLFIDGDSIEEVEIDGVKYGYINVTQEGGTDISLINNIDGICMFTVNMKSSADNTVSIGDNTTQVSTEFRRISIPFTTTMGEQVSLTLPKGEYWFREAMVTKGTIVPAYWQPSLVDMQDNLTQVYSVYSELYQNFDSFKTMVGETYQLKSDMVNYTTVSRFSTLEQNLGKFETIVSETYTTKDEVSANYSTISQMTTVSQTANKINFLVASGESASEFTLTDRTVKLVADGINLQGLVTFSGLSSSAQKKINDISDVANNANSEIQNVEDNIYTLNTTTINGGKITTGSIEADKLKANTITSDKIDVEELTASKTFSDIMSAQIVLVGNKESTKIASDAVKAIKLGGKNLLVDSRDLVNENYYLS